MSTTKDFIDSIQAASKERTSAYDTTATVKRVEGNTAWVHIPGGVDETPVKLTISAKEGDQVQVRVSGGSAFMVGNGTNPPTDDTRANSAYSLAAIAEGAAENALGNAARAREAADAAQVSASAAESAAGDAVIAAGDAQTAAGNAQQSADSALVSLATAQDVVGVLNWITAHGTMTLTSDVAVNPAHVYFVVDAGGDYVVGGTHYSIVSEPKDAELSTYYELTVDESVQNYVATHIVVDTEGLWIVPDAGGNKVLIATGAGSTYTTAGTYIVGKVNNVDTVLAKFTADGAIIGENASGKSRTVISSDGMQVYRNVSGTDTQIAQLGYGAGTDSGGGTKNAPYYTLGKRYAGSDIGNYSTAEGYNTTSGAYGSHSGGLLTETHGDCSFVHGHYNYIGKATVYTYSRGLSTSVFGIHNKSSKCAQFVIGVANKEDTTYNTQDWGSTSLLDVGKYAFIIGNGTLSNSSPTGQPLSRSNALTVDWNGNVDIASGAKYKINGTALAASDVGAEPTLTNINESGGTYSGGIEDEKLLTTATITKWQTILGI